MMNTSHERKSNQNKDKPEKNQPRNGLDCLPLEVRFDILSRLHIKSLIQCSYVCRTWKSLSYDPDLINLHLSRAINNHIILSFHCDYPLRNQLYFVEFSDQDDNRAVREICTPFSDIMPEFRVVSSCKGLLCLSNSLLDDAPYVYNPFTGEYKELPKSTQFQDQDVVLGFGFHPITNEYRVIRIVYYWNLYELSSRLVREFKYRSFPQSEVQVFCQGSNGWRSIGEVPYRIQQSGVLVNGRLHWVSIRKKHSLRRERTIVSFDLSDELFREVPLPYHDEHPCCHSLTVLGGNLCIVDPSNSSFDGVNIWVMKKYGIKESWVKEFSIGAYLPNIVGQEMRQSYKIWKNVIEQRLIRVLCLLKNGEILLQYRWGALVCYNPETVMFKDIKFPGMPKLFETFVQIGSLTPVGTLASPGAILEN